MIEASASGVVRKMTHLEFIDACNEFGDTWSGRFFVEWSDGGDWRNCWGEVHACDKEEEPEFPELDAFLEKYFPHTTYLQYKSIQKAIVHDDRSDSDYYGGVQYYKSKALHFDNLEDVLIEKGLLEIIA